MIINLSLTNSELYAGCETEEVAGKINLTTPVEEATNIIGRNINKIIDSIPASERDEVILTGAMAIWSYLIVFHAVVHKFKIVRYDDGKGNNVIVAKHG